MIFSAVKVMNKGKDSKVNLKWRMHDSIFDPSKGNHMSSVHSFFQTPGSRSTHIEPWNLDVVVDYGNPEAEYDACVNRMAISDESFVEHLELTGKDALNLLHRLSTSELAGMQTGQVQPTVLTSEKGRVLDVLTVIKLEDRLHVICSPTRGDRVEKWIDRYTIREDVRSQRSDFESVLLTGTRTGEWISRQFGIPLPGFVSQRDDLILQKTASGWRLMGPSNKLIDRMSEYCAAGAVRAGYLATESLRLENRIPQWGFELSESVNPLEVGLKNVISFKKGCYVGQEVIARLDSYEKVQRHLILLKLERDIGLPAVLSVSGDDVGLVTSTCFSFKYCFNIALSILRTAYCQPDRDVDCLSTNSQQKTIATVLSSHEFL